MRLQSFSQVMEPLPTLEISSFNSKEALSGVFLIPNLPMCPSIMSCCFPEESLGGTKTCHMLIGGKLPLITGLLNSNTMRIVSFRNRGGATTILCSGKLFQQFIIDTWAAAEQSRLWYIKQNQSRLRVDLYQGCGCLLWP